MAALGPGLLGPLPSGDSLLVDLGWLLLQTLWNYDHVNQNIWEDHWQPGDDSWFTSDIWWLDGWIYFNVISYWKATKSCEHIFMLLQKFIYSERFIMLAIYKWTGSPALKAIQHRTIHILPSMMGHGAFSRMSNFILHFGLLCRLTVNE